MKVNRPQIVGHYTNDIVRARLAPGVLEELKHLNPTDRTGNRPVKHHQRLTLDVGHPKLQEHLTGVIALMKSVVRHKGGWGEFLRRLQRVYAKVHVTPDLFDD